ncbi:hypothetical protein LOD99_4607 [Oopsacas minuta]|uniref:Uncharacterized protein n=1 Tax=Oopsacas minuta TaxID=111878 RepID=A0AAV7JTI0_9METZ|nr:hypothetical protein LOD99_4607 [Oopsacas minuta]
MEKSFILDGVPLSNLSNNDVFRSSPQHDISLPSYNPVKDKHCRVYFQFASIPRAVSARISRNRPLSTQAGHHKDVFLERCSSVQYISHRNRNGAGYSWDTYRGHDTEVYKPVIGWNGDAGYRTNTFKLRYQPSSFNMPVEKRFARIDCCSKSNLSGRFYEDSPPSYTPTVTPLRSR